MNHSNILTTVGVAVIMLVIGVALGSVLLPNVVTNTITTTQNDTSFQTVVSIRSETIVENSTLTYRITYPAYTITERIIPVEIVLARISCHLAVTFSNSTVYVFPSVTNTSYLYHYFNATIYTTFQSSMIIISNLTTTESITQSICT
jgi:hypothetical protein